jgi:diadenosine tetraphosphate (Ap4A) HIT family hydrolase
MKNCDGCSRIHAAAEGNNPHLIHEFDSSLLFLGDHQYFEGYCVLMLKRHVRELHELEPMEYQRLMEELIQATRAVDAAFRPWKLNHSCLGNALPHIHWHIMPRYESDPDRMHNPWFNMDDFKNHVPDQERRETLIAKIRAELL